MPVARLCSSVMSWSHGDSQASRRGRPSRLGPVHRGRRTVSPDVRSCSLVSGLLAAKERRHARRCRQHEANPRDVIRSSRCCDVMTILFYFLAREVVDFRAPGLLA